MYYRYMRTSERSIVCFFLLEPRAESYLTRIREHETVFFIFFLFFLSASVSEPWLGFR